MSLPDPSTFTGSTGRLYAFQKTDASANTVTLTATGGATINGSPTQVLTAQHETMWIHYNGVEWKIIATVP